MQKNNNLIILITIISLINQIIDTRMINQYYQLELIINQKLTQIHLNSKKNKLITTIAKF